MTQTPWLRFPLTDLTSQFCTHQWNGRCADFELRAIECMEAYGLDRGLKKCNDLIEDFRECANRQKQVSRGMTMRIERNRQYYAGERTKDNLYAPPPKGDAF